MLKWLALVPFLLALIMGLAPFFADMGLGAILYWEFAIVALAIAAAFFIIGFCLTPPKTRTPAPPAP